MMNIAGSEQRHGFRRRVLWGPWGKSFFSSVMAAVVCLGPAVALASGGGGEEPPGLIEINGSLIIQIVNFLVLMIVLNSLLYKPIRKIVKERKQTFANFENAISGLNNQVDQRTKDMENRMTEAKRDGFARKDELKALGLAEEKKIVGAATSAADADLQKVREQVKSDVASARISLQAEVQVFSKELAQKVLGRSLS